MINKNFISVFFVLILGVASYNAALGGAPTRPVSRDINSYVLFAYDELIFKGGNINAGWGHIINGDIGVNYGGNGIVLDYATSNVAIMSDGYQAVADIVRADADGSFWDLYANGVNPSFAATIRNAGPIPFTTPIIPTNELPDFPFTPNRALTNNASNITIGGIGIPSPYSFTPGAYKDVRINDNSIVTFGPGIFDIRDLSIGKNVTINVDENTILQIDLMFTTNEYLEFGIGTNSGAHVYVGGYGSNPTTTPVVHFSHHAEVHAQFFVPTGWLNIGGTNNLYGKYWAQRITGDPNNNVYFEECDKKLTIKKFVGVPSQNCISLIQDWNFTSNIPNHAAFSIHAGTPVMIGNDIVGYSGEITFTDVDAGNYQVTETFIPAGQNGGYYHPSNSCQATQTDTSTATVVVPAGCGTVTCTFSNIPVCGDDQPPSCDITGEDTICEGGSSQLCALEGAASYTWSTNETTRCITVSAAGTYSVKVTDSNGITSVCSFDLTVNPVPACSIISDDNSCPSVSKTFAAPVGMDSYSWTVTGNATKVGESTNSTFEVSVGSGCNTQYTVAVTISLNDCSSTCDTIVSIVDETKPEITCPDDKELQCGQSSEPSNTGSATATDNCTTNPTITHRDVPVSGCVAGSIDRWWKATDACGNKDSCLQKIRYVDTSKPEITCPANKELQCGQSSAPSNTGSATATDNCTGNPTITYRDEPVSGCAAPGIDRWWKATDACGNKDSCLQQIRYVDTTKPTINCPSNKNLSCGQSTAPANTGTASGNDNCGTPTITYRDEAVTACVAGIDRWWKATDGCGNKDSCLQQIRFTDTSKPTIYCPSDKNLQCGQSSAPSNTGTATGNDNCSGTPSITYRDVAVAAGCAGVAGIDRWWKATDACNNKDSCLQKIRYVDTTIPTINCPSNKTLNCYVSSVTFDTPTANDNCDANPSIIIVSTNTVTNGNGSKTYTRTWKAKDACNNYSNTCSQSITVPALLTVTCSSNNITGTITAYPSGGTSPYYYSWSTNPVQTTKTATITVNGTYTVKVTDSKGCTATTSCSVNVCNGFRTQTMGGWGTACSGTNPGCYRDAKFAQAFPSPNYLTIGCTNKLVLTTSAAVMKVMPASGTPAKLPNGTMTNPKKYDNTFAAQLIAATLSVKFDLIDPNFSSSTTHLEDLIVNSGTFAGWTVKQVIAEANRLIGGCASIYTPSQMTQVLDGINSNYVDGTMNGGFLNCPSQGRIANATELNDGNIFSKAYPNPFNTTSTIEFSTLENTSNTRVEVYSVSGEKVATLFNESTEAGITYYAQFNAEFLAEGIYVYRIVYGEHLVNGKLILIR